MANNNWKKEVFTIPNILSFVRLLLIPVYVVIFLNARTSSDYFISACILAVSCLTDLIDGKIARHFNMVSHLGTVLDPLADKLTQLAMILCLAYNHPILWYLVGLFVVKESFQLIAGGIRLRKGSMLKGAQMTGKICTTVLFISLIALVVFPTMNETIVNIIVIIDAIFMLIAFIDYLIVYKNKDSKFEAVRNPSGK